jgi:hypothetical protein
MMSCTDQFDFRPPFGDTPFPTMSELLPGAKKSRYIPSAATATQEYLDGHQPTAHVSTVFPLIAVALLQVPDIG